MHQSEIVLGPFAARSAGSGCWEILGPNGTVIAWVVTEAVAVKLTALLNLAHGAGLIDRVPDDQ